MFFCSSKVGKTIRAFITVVSCSDLNVKLFTSLFISSIKDLYLDPEGNKNSDFLQWPIVWYTSSNLFFNTSLLAFPIFFTPKMAFVMGKTNVDVVSMTFLWLLVFLWKLVCVNLALVIFKSSFTFGVLFLDEPESFWCWGRGSTLLLLSYDFRP